MIEDSCPSAFAVETHGLTKRYGVTAVVDHIDLSVPRGAVYGFLGPNGAGKSTTMKMLLGLVHKSEGTAQVLGEELTPASRLSVLRSVGSLIESPSCYPHLTAMENLEIVRQLRHLPKSEISRVLEIVRLDDTATLKKRVAQFSLGMRQRLGIATALMGNPPLLLLDEPTNGLDPSGIHEIRKLIRSLPECFGITALVSSHLLSEVDQMADHVGIIDHGHLVWQGAMADLHARGKRWLSLRTTNDTRALDVLPDLTRDEDGTLHLSSADDATVGKMSLLLARNGIGIVRMEEHAESLEDIFLSLTGMEASL